MKELNKTLDKIIHFINFNKESLIDHIVNDLKIKNVDTELSKILCSVECKLYDVSIEDITDVITLRINNAIKTFKKPQ